MNLFRFLVRRGLRGLLTLWFVATLVFVGTRLSGDPTDWLLPDDAGPEARAALRSHLGIDQPLVEQYRRYLVGALRGDFGTSFYEHRPVYEIYRERLPVTLTLMGQSLLISVLLGTSIGVACSVFHNRPLDRVLMGFSFCAYAVPNFVLGITLILLFSLLLPWLPSGGIGGWHHFLMPTLTLATAYTATIARMTRSAMLEVLTHDYVRTARAKGVREFAVVFRHSFRNALPPVLTVIGLLMAGLLAGSVVVERVFALPGAGRLIVDAVLRRDYPVLQFAVLAVAVTVVLVNLLVDLGYAIIDPRIRVEA